MLENLGGCRNPRDSSLVRVSITKEPGSPEEDDGQSHDEHSAELSDLEDSRNGDHRALVTSSGDDGHGGDSEYRSDHDGSNVLVDVKHEGG